MQRRRRPRALTLTLPDTSQPHLLLGGRLYTLRNFSEDGIGLWMPGPPPFGLSSGTRVSGDIEIGQHIYPVQLEVAHASQRMVGLKIVHKSPELSVLFKNLLEPVTHAGELTPESRSGAEDPETGYRRLWYTNGKTAELVVWYHETRSMIQALQLTWLGHWVFRSQFQAPRTGQLPDPLSPGGKEFKPKDLLKIDNEPDLALLSQAAQFLGAVPPPLPGYLLWQFLETGDVVNLPLEVLPPKKVA